jgi:hypothetical protein
MRDLEHASISGVEVMEQYNKVGIAGSHLIASDGA